ncbi:MAG: tetratricopeptide repeat protein [Myxococcota bacterium]
MRIEPLALSLALLSASGPAWSASLDAAIGQLDQEAAELRARATTLELDTRPGAYLSPEEAVSRFQDYLFLHLVGEHEQAAEGFFALVTTGVLADAGLHRDAEWYLAESLVGLENYRTAITRFQVIVDDPEHPFRDDAVRRLLEIYALTGDREAFDELYRAEIASGKVKPTGLITYSLAKSFFQQDELDQAASYFDQVPEGNPYYGRARYFLGAVQVKRGDLEAAKETFAQVSQLSIDTTEDRMVHDLALLALGRIAYHEEDWLAAAEHYNAIGGDSVYQADKLYEIIWTSIRREKWQDALNNVEIFLLAYPEHAYSAELRLLQGHLNFQQQDWDHALGAYEQVISEYKPVQVRFGELAQPGSSADGAVRTVLEAAEEPTDLPDYAVAMMRADPELSRAMAVFRDLAREEDDIQASERLIEELESFISGTGAIGSYERIRTDTLVARGSATDAQMRLLAIEHEWLSTVEGVDRAKLDELERRRVDVAARADALVGTVRAAADRLDSFEREMAELHADADNARREGRDAALLLDAARNDLRSDTLSDDGRSQLMVKIDALQAQVDSAKTRQQAADERMSHLDAPHSADVVDIGALTSINGEINELVDGYWAARPQRPGLVFGDRASAVHRALSDAQARFTGVSDAIAQIEGTEVAGIRTRFEAEVAAVAQERADHEVLLGDARAVSLDITREGFGRLEDFFAGSILKADMGIVDVFWAEQLEIADELDRMRKERESQMAELELRFSLIREKMGTKELPAPPPPAPDAGAGDAP